MLITGTDFENGIVNYSSCHYVEKGRYEQDKNIQLKNESILVTKDGTLGKVAYINNLRKPATLNAGVFNIRIKDKKNDSSKYVFQYLKAPFLMNYVYKTATGGTIKHLNQNILVDFPINSPKYDEQSKVGVFFCELDNLITLHQRKYDKLVNVKKSLLEKMFPKNDSNVPEIRFKGFTEAWEQRKLGDIVDLRGRIGFRGYKRTDLVAEGSGAVTFSPADIDDDGHLSLTNNTYISFEKYEESPEIKVKEGDILFTKTASIGKIAYVSKLKEKSTINPQFALLTPNKNIDGYFLFLSLRTEECLKYVRDISGGSSIPTMSQEKLKEMKIICPTLKEQHIMGEYYKKLDNLITLHQRKLEKLKNIKKSLLEKMFV